MATTIIRTPEPFQPSLSDGLFFTVSANTTNQPKFRYVYEVYINNFLVFEGKATPNPYGLGVIDLQRILDNYTVNYPISYYQNTAIFTHQTGVFSRPYSNEVVEYFIKVGEEYAASSLEPVSGFTGIGTQIGLPGVSSNSFKSFLSSMGVNRNSVLENFNIGKFTLSGSPTPSFPNTTNCLFLTNSPRIRDIDTSEYYTLSFTNEDLGSPYFSEPYYVQYRFYDNNGTIISISDYANITSNGGGPLSSCTQTYYDITNQDTSPYNILNVGAGPMNIPNFPANTGYYQIQLYGKAPVPSPSPTASPTPTPTPSQTIGLTPTPTPSVSPSPSAPGICSTYQVENFVGFTIQVFYTACTGVATSVYVGPYSYTSICAYSVTNPGYGINITNIAPCSPPSVTPTPSPSAGAGTSGVSGTTLNITDTGWLKYTDSNGNVQYVNVTSLGTYTISPCHDCNSIAPGIPFADLANWDVKVCGPSCGTPSVTPTPTPSSSPVPYIAVYIRDCCTGTQSFQVLVDNNLEVGNVIVIANQCYEIYALGGNGSGGDYRGAENYVVCIECTSNYPCTTTPPNPAVVKPNVQPTTFTPTGGTAPCVSYSPVSEIFQFNVVDKCNQFGNEQFMFKNRYGAWDYFLFTRARIEGMGIERQTYGQYNETWGSSSPQKTNYSRGLTDFQIDITETHISNSGFLSQPEFVWLEELYTSNDVYLIQENGTIFPINIVSTEFVRKTKGNRQLINLEITYTYSNNIKLLNG